MLYDITAVISYRYEGPSVSGRSVLRLMPATVPGVQRLVAGAIESSPGPAERRDRVDFFGTPVTELVLREAATETRFRLKARVERLALPPELDLSPAPAALAAEIAGLNDIGAEAPHHFLPASDRVRPHRTLTSFAHDAAAAEAAQTTLGFVTAVGRAMHAHMRYDPDATTVETDMLEAFTAGHGVCQDFAHAMIGALRGAGIPAGYVSGYLRTLPPPGAERLTGADAMHAWVRAWCGVEAGWVEYDPTNACLVGPDHIRVGVGRDYDDVAPVRGVLRVAGGQVSRQEVDVEPLGPLGAG